MPIKTTRQWHTYMNLHHDCNRRARTFFPCVISRTIFKCWSTKDNRSSQKQCNYGTK